MLAQSLPAIATSPAGRAPCRSARRQRTLLSLRRAQSVESTVARGSRRRAAQFLLRRLPGRRADHHCRRTRRLLFQPHGRRSAPGCGRRRRVDALGRVRGRGGARARDRPGSRRGSAAARGPDLRSVRVAARVMARPAAGCGGSARQLRQSACGRRVGSSRDPAVASAARRVRDRIFRASLRPRLERGVGASRTAGVVAAGGGGDAGDDAGDDVRAAGLRIERRRGSGTAAPAGMGELRADAAGARVFGRAVLPRRLA